MSVIVSDCRDSQKDYERKGITGLQIFLQVRVSVFVLFLLCCVMHALITLSLSKATLRLHGLQLRALLR